MQSVYKQIPHCFMLLNYLYDPFVIVHHIKLYIDQNLLEFLVSLTPDIENILTATFDKLLCSKHL